MPAFAAVIVSGWLGSTALFGLGVFAMGVGVGLFGHGTLTATMRSAPEDRVGLALGAWGAVQASAGGLALALGGVLRDAFEWLGAASGYNAVYALEIVLLAATLRVLWPLLPPRAARSRPVGHNG